MTRPMHFDMRIGMHRMRENPGAGSEIRFEVLVQMMLYSNISNRVWVSTQTLSMFRHKTAVREAKRWLVEHGAMYPIPVEKRMPEEAYLPKDVVVYQLTGFIVLDSDTGEWCPYFQFYDDEMRKNVLLHRLNPDVRMKMPCNRNELTFVGKKPTKRGGTLSAPPISGGDVERSDTEGEGGTLNAPEVGTSLVVVIPKGIKTPSGLEQATPAKTQPRKPCDSLAHTSGGFTPPITQNDDETTGECKLAAYIAALVDEQVKQVNPSHMASTCSKTTISKLTKGIIIQGDGSENRYPSPESMFANDEPGYIQFVEEVAKSYEFWFNQGKKSASERINTIVGQLRKLDREDASHPGWLAWKEIRKPAAAIGKPVITRSSTSNAPDFKPWDLITDEQLAEADREAAERMKKNPVRKTGF